MKLVVPETRLTRFLIAFVLFVVNGSAVAEAPHSGSPANETQHQQGQKVYDFYCYQCHAYSGNARTLASTYLDPTPRDFTAADPARLTREAMLQAVTAGRPGTAMVSFASVLSPSEIEAVISYVRDEFMQGQPPSRRYHTKENGWASHERYAQAFPFVTGEIRLDGSWEVLTPQQQQGKRLYLRACVSCHDRPRAEEGSPIWELRPLSYPRNGYVHQAESVDAFTGASPYALHDVAPRVSDLSADERLGERLYQQNCAFCHAADGTGRNWIGSFLEPHPRDLTSSRVAVMSDAQLEAVIREGLPGTSMPAWGGALDERQITAVIGYLRKAFNNRSEQHPAAETAAPARPRPREALGWHRVGREE